MNRRDFIASLSGALASGAISASILPSSEPLETIFKTQADVDAFLKKHAVVVDYMGSLNGFDTFEEAWDSVPPVVSEPITITLTPGTHRGDPVIQENTVEPRMFYLHCNLCLRECLGHT